MVYRVVWSQLSDRGAAGDAVTERMKEFCVVIDRYLGGNCL